MKKLLFILFSLIVLQSIGQEFNSVIIGTKLYDKKQSVVKIEGVYFIMDIKKTSSGVIHSIELSSEQTNIGKVDEIANYFENYYNISLRQYRIDYSTNCFKGNINENSKIYIEYRKAALSYYIYQIKITIYSKLRRTQPISF